MTEEIKKYHTIGGREFYVPTAIQYNQYYTATKLLEKNAIKFGETVDVEVKGAEIIDIVFRAGKAIGDIVSKNIVPEFFAIMLVPKEEKSWKKEYVEENRECMEVITDIQMMAVFSDFLTNKKPLIENLMLKWKGFQNDTSKSKQK